MSQDQGHIFILALRYAEFYFEFAFNSYANFNYNFVHLLLSFNQKFSMNFFFR